MHLTVKEIYGKYNWTYHAGPDGAFTFTGITTSLEEVIACVKQCDKEVANHLLND